MSDPTTPADPTPNAGSTAVPVQRRTRWGIVFLAALLSFLGALFLGSLAPSLNPFSSRQETNTREVIGAVRTEEQVVLLRLGIQGISERKTNGRIFGLDIPGSERATYIQYNFNASLGLEGKDVTISKAGEHTYNLSMPEFIFIGHDNVEFKLIAENNQVLSVFTPQNDDIDMINEILSDGAKDEYVGANREFLEEQARDFCEGIIKGVDPEATVNFTFTG